MQDSSDPTLRISNVLYYRQKGPRLAANADRDTLRMPLNWGNATQDGQFRAGHRRPEICEEPSGKARAL